LRAKRPNPRRFAQLVASMPIFTLLRPQARPHLG
jgi:hypothetical protein